MIQAQILNAKQFHQGDILKNVDYIERADVIDGYVEVSKIRYPYVIVLSQECDLTQDYAVRTKSEDKKGSQDKLLRSMIVAPMYNFEHFIMGQHYSNFGYQMAIDYLNSKTARKTLKQNNNPRYHFLEFDESIPVVASVIDFKHFFTVDIATLYTKKQEHYVCSLDPLFRERVSQRFANYLARIGLPDGR